MIERSSPGMVLHLENGDHQGEGSIMRRFIVPAFSSYLISFNLNGAAFAAASR